MISAPPKHFRPQTHASIHEADEVLPLALLMKPQLTIMCRKKSENAARLRMKKMHGDKKRARKGGGREDF
jgi:hypothetical protein